MECKSTNVHVHSFDVKLTPDTRTECNYFSSASCHCIKLGHEQERYYFNDGQRKGQTLDGQFKCSSDKCFTPRFSVCILYLQVAGGIAAKNVRGGMFRYQIFRFNILAY